MKKIISIIIIFLFILLFSCKKDTEPESVITAEVIKEPELIEDEIVEEIPENIEIVTICYDNDNGIVRWEKGKIMGYYNNATRFEFDDYCIDKNYLMEYYCENEEPLHQIFLCKNGCTDSHCA